MRMMLGVLVLTAQVAAIGYARVVPSRYFCWAPYDALSVYELGVALDGQPLPAEAALARYRLRGNRDNRSIQHVIDIIEQYEQTYGRSDRATVRLRYQTNGREWREWRWPLD